MSYHRSGTEFTITTDTCFHCHREIPLGVSRVWWMGSTEDGQANNIKFHPRCALAFHLRFARDLHEMDCDLELTETHARREWRNPPNKGEF